MEKKVKNGVIKYHYPNFAETQIILGEMGFGLVDNKNNNKNIDLIYLGRFLKIMYELIDSVEIEGVDTYDKLLNKSEYSRDLNSLAAELIEKMLDFGEDKKKDSES